MFHNFCFIICFASIISSVLCEVICSVVAPGAIHSYLKYNIAISIHEADGPCKIQIGISSTKYNISEVVDILPMSTKNVIFELPRLEDDRYRLKVNGVAGITVDNSTDLIYDDYKPLILIQTDKANYKPGDVVQYRVLFLDENTRPSKLKTPTKTIIIRDPYQNRVQLLKDFEIIHGVFIGNLELSDKPMLGFWSIEVYVDGKISGSTILAVSNDDLPRFDVIIDTAEHVALTDEVFEVTISSHYTFGKAVKGKAYIEVSDGSNFGSKRKTISFDGEGHVEFNIQDDGFSELIDSDEKRLTISATVVEDLGGSKVKSSKTFFLHKNNITITPIIPKVRHSFGKPATYKVAINKLDGSPIQDKKNHVTLHIGKEDFLSLIDENGIATFTFTPSPNVQFLEVKCSYLGIVKNFEQLRTEISDDTEELIELTLQTKKPQLGKNIYINVQWKEPIKYFIYIVTSRDNIITTEHVKVNGVGKSYSPKLYTITIEAKFETMPKAVLVQYFYKNNLRFKEIAIEFEEEFQNTLELSTTAKASPGDDIEIQISTDPNSFVGILAVDKRVLLLGTGNDITKEVILRGLNKYQTITPPLLGSGRYPGIVSGLVTMTNANYPYKYSERIYYRERTDTTSDRASIRRNQFLDVWIYEEFYTGNNTKFSFHKKLPDSLTTWVITGFSLNTKTGIALTKNPETILVSKPFFITVNLPYSVKNGEIISIPVLIFNNMNETHEIEVSMDNSDKNYEFVEVDECILDHAKSLKRITISANSAGSVSFIIQPTSIGITTVKITALMGLIVDTVHQILRVEPVGITRYHNRTFNINLNDKDEQQESMTIEIPADAVPNSERIEISAIGDLIGLTFENLENLEHISKGSGEQNMLNFVPSILVLKYLRTIKLDMPQLTKKALSILKIGYQRELIFKHENGCFGDYGSDSQSSAYIGSTWLTAYVARSFQQAAEFIDIDAEIIKNALDFLISQQTINGNFVEKGMLAMFPYTDDLALTAYVLLAFLEDEENHISYDTIIKKGIVFLIENLDASNNTHSLSITALVLQKVEHSMANELIIRLQNVAENENGYIWWAQNIDKKSKNTLFNTNSSAIEITSYVLQAMLENETKKDDVFPIVKWLIMQRNIKGGFASTLDTAVSLQALIKFAEKTGLKSAVKMDIDFVCEGGEVEDNGTIAIQPENSIILMKHELPKQTRKVKLTAKGNSSSLVQISYQYNVVEKQVESDFQLNITIRRNTPPKQLVVYICTEFDPPADSDVSGVDTVVLEVTLPSGFTADRIPLNDGGYNRKVVYAELKKSRSIAVFHLKKLKIGKQRCLNVQAILTYDVAEQKPVPVVIYDFNGNYRKAIKYYEIKTPFCVTDECKLNCTKSAHSFSGPKLNLNFLYFVFNLQLCILQLAVQLFE